MNSQNQSNQNYIVILHVYELQPDPSQQQQISTTDRALLMVSGILPTIGMGAYHSSLEVMNLKYTFAANAGVMVGRANGPDVGVPRGAVYKHTVNLGTCYKTREEVLEIIQRLSQLFFTNQAYDMLTRNCNHFTETLAIALLAQQEPKASPPTFPKWLNRLASTAGYVVSKTSEVNPGPVAPCDPLQEAKLAMGY